MFALDPRADMLGLGPHLLHQPRPLDRLGEARIILDVGGDHQLAARLEAREQQRLQHGARGVDRGGVAGRTRADDDHALARGPMRSRQDNPLSEDFRPPRLDPQRRLVSRSYMGGRDCATTRSRGRARNNAPARLCPKDPIMLVLRAAAASPFVRKVRIAAAVLELDDRIEVVRRRHQRSRRFLEGAKSAGENPGADPGERRGPLRQRGDRGVPRLARGRRPIIPGDPAQRFRSLTRQALADGIAEAAVLMRYEGLWRDADKRSERWLAYQGDKISRALKAFEASPPEELSDIGTIALACALGYLDLRFEGAWRADRPRLAGWLDLFSAATPSFEATRFHG